LVEQISEKSISTPYGPFRLHAFHDKTVDEVHLALTRGDIRPDVPVLTRVHEPFTSLDLFDFDTGRHAYSVTDAMRLIATEGTGVIVLLRGPESAESMRARFAAPDDVSKRPAKWDPRMYGIGAQILHKLHVGKMRVLAWPKKIPSMSGFDLEVVEYVPPSNERKLHSVG
jgi:3,4-dihydroxy 2-butanone 4-phosphate synthase/GTP cyclohydrolase II